MFNVKPSNRFLTNDWVPAPTNTEQLDYTVNSTGVVAGELTRIIVTNSGSGYTTQTKTACTFSSGATTITLANTTNLVANMAITGTGITTGTYITNIDIDNIIQMIENIKIIIKKTTKKIKLYDLKKKKINKKKKVLYNMLNNDVDLINHKLIDTNLTEDDIDRLQADLDITNMIYSSYPIYNSINQYDINKFTQLYYKINETIDCSDSISNIINIIKSNNNCE
jgi:hypothetical protein